MTIKEKLYQGIIKRELKDKYEEDKHSKTCKYCNAYAPKFDPIWHYRRCPTAQLERILVL